MRLAAILPLVAVATLFASPAHSQTCDCDITLRPHQTRTASPDTRPCRRLSPQWGIDLLTLRWTLHAPLQREEKEFLER